MDWYTLTMLKNDALVYQVYAHHIHEISTNSTPNRKGLERGHWFSRAEAGMLDLGSSLRKALPHLHRTALIDNIDK